jgi:antirestriction protein ArdC
MKKTIKKDAFAKVNELVMAGIQKDGLKWFKSWRNESGSICEPINRMTKKEYRGINVFMLNAEASFKGYSCNEWLTYKQAQTLNGQVRKGEQSTMVVFWSISYKDKETGKWYPNESAVRKAGLNPNDLDKAFSLKTYNVFNVDQCDGIEAINENIEVEDTEFTPIEKAEKVVGNYISSNNRLTLGWGGDSAYYSPSQDHVQMPKKNTFVDADSYYKVLFHELGHSTGHESRLNRSGITGVSQFGSTTYSKEELVAEMIAVYCADFLNLDPKDGMSNSFAYIKSWMQKLTDDVAKDKKYLVNAMTQAHKGVKLIMG